MVCDGVAVIGKAHERIVLGLPYLFETAWPLGAYDENFCISRYELFILLTQLREVGAAVGSHETARENQQYVPFPVIIREAYGVPLYVGQLKIRGCLPCSDLLGHF